MVRDHEAEGSNPFTPILLTKLPAKYLPAVTYDLTLILKIWRKSSITEKNSGVKYRIRRHRMTSEKRRVQIEKILNNNTEPVTASYFAKEFSVSRQVIVGDIALMRAGGLKISATPRGYILDREEDSKCVFTVACCHDDITLADELYAIVDKGGTVQDVIVEHPIYGEIIGELHIQSRYDVDLFLKKLKENKVQPLLRLTDGIHLHTIKCRDEESKNRIIDVLKSKKFILEQE